MKTTGNNQKNILMNKGSIIPMPDTVGEAGKKKQTRIERKTSTETY